MGYKNFTMISNDLIHDNKLPPKAKALYGLLASLAQRNKQRVCKIGIRTIQDILVIGSSHTVIKLLHVLENEGWLEISNKLSGRCNTYKVPFSKNCNNFGKNGHGTDALIDTPPLHSLQPININEDDIEDEELIEWNIQQLNN